MIMHDFPPHGIDADMRRYLRPRIAGATCFFTVVSYRRRLIFCDPPFRESLRNTVLRVRAVHPFKPVRHGCRARPDAWSHSSLHRLIHAGLYPAIRQPPSRAGKTSIRSSPIQHPQPIVLHPRVIALHPRVITIQSRVKGDHPHKNRLHPRPEGLHPLRIHHHPRVKIHPGPCKALPAGQRRYLSRLDRARNRCASATCHAKRCAARPPLFLEHFRERERIGSANFANASIDTTQTIAPGITAGIACRIASMNRRSRIG